MLAQPCATLAQMRPLAAEILQERGLVFFIGCSRRLGVCGFEL